jgi:hypothetical protein
MEFNPVSESTHEQIDFIESLLTTSTISSEENEFHNKRLSCLNYFDCEVLIEYLLTKQVERIGAGLNYNMGYLKNFMKKTI